MLLRNEGSSVSRVSPKIFLFQKLSVAFKELLPSEILLLHSRQAGQNTASSDSISLACLRNLNKTHPVYSEYPSKFISCLQQPRPSGMLPSLPVHAPGTLAPPCRQQPGRGGSAPPVPRGCRALPQAPGSCCSPGGLCRALWLPRQSLIPIPGRFLHCLHSLQMAL